MKVYKPSLYGDQTLRLPAVSNKQLPSMRLASCLASTTEEHFMVSGDCPFRRLSFSWPTSLSVSTDKLIDSTCSKLTKGINCEFKQKRFCDETSYHIHTHIQQCSNQLMQRNAIWWNLLAKHFKTSLNWKRHEPKQKSNPQCYFIQMFHLITVMKLLWILF